MNKFEQIEVLEQRAETALAKNADDATAIRELAEIKHLAGHTGEAIALLKRAYGLSPDDPLVRDMLGEYLLEGLSADFNANRADLPLLRRLLAGQPQELRMLRMEARALEKSGDRLGAWDAYGRLADRDSAQSSLLTVDDNSAYSVRSDRWLSGRLAALWGTATSSERTAMAARAEIATGKLGAEPGIDALERLSVAVRWATRLGPGPPRAARRYLKARQFDAAEIQLLALANAAENETRAAADALLTQELVECAKYDAAAVAAARLLGEWSGTPVGEGLTGPQWVQRLAHDRPPFARAVSQAWPRGKVSAQNVASSGPAGRPPFAGRPDRIQPQTGYRRLRIEQEYPGSVSTDDWLLSTDGSQLVARNCTGGDFLALAIEQNARTRPLAENSYVHAARLGQLVVASLGNRIVAIDGRQDGDIDESDILWQAYPLGKFQVPATSRSRTRTPRNPAIYVTVSDRRRDLLATAAGALGPVTPRGVVFYDQGELKCVDPLSGETLWARKDIPRGCELFGDDEFVCAAEPKEHDIYVLRMLDGETIERRKMNEMSWLLTTGRNVATVQSRPAGGATKTNISVVDGATGKLLVETTHPLGSLMTVVEPNLVAIYDPTGKFQVIDVRQGKLIIDQTLEPYPDAQRIFASESGDQFVLGISTNVQIGKHQSLSADFVPLNGLVYAFSLSTGQPLWPAPAVVRERFLWLAAPRELPLIIFAEREAQRDTGGGSAKLRLLCLDGHTGRSVYRNDDLPDTLNGQFRVRVQPAADSLDAESNAGPPRDVIIVEMSAREIRLTPTDQPQPPEPPAQDDLVAAREFSTQGMSALLERATRALQESQPGNSQPGRGRRGNRRGR